MPESTAPSRPGDQIGLASVYCWVTSNSLAQYESAACATATRPVYRRCPIISKGVIVFDVMAYSPSALTCAYRLSSEERGMRTRSKLIHALSKSFPVVLTPMSPTDTPRTSSPSSRRLIKKACGPRRSPPTVRSARTTALSAVKPCEIQFFCAPTAGVLRTNSSVSASKSHVVCTRRPLCTPASFSVSAKQPSSPRSWMASRPAICSSLPTARTVPMHRL
mmetsp:Transcript_494/g.1211  ORF Transcript_494/g.1211 Transcript_494/m.1211 type:complete len:220 (+) Transcript_494:73-732(+)